MNTPAPVPVNVVPDVLPIQLPNGSAGLMFAIGIGPLGTHLVGEPDSIVALLEMSLDKARALAADAKRANSGLVTVQSIPSDVSPNGIRRPHVPVSMPWQR